MKESEALELKTSTAELKEAIVSISPILNKHQKGELYFGVKNSGEVVGQVAAENTVRRISQTISDNIEPKIFPKINEVVLDGKKCVHVEFSGNNIPYYAFGRAYIRVGDEDRKISSQELERLILKKNRVFWEEEISEKTLKEINEEILKNFVERANVAKRIDFKFTDVKSALNKLGLMRGDKLLKAAEVLFCDDSQVENQAAVFAGKDKLTFLDIRQFKGNVFQLLQQSESYIKEHINWMAELKERMRKEVPEIPLRAITEALVNSLCHRDYANRKGNEIAVFKDRVEIYNPGQFPEGYSPRDFIRGAERSILRNPLIANTLYLSKDIERWGSGLKRIHDECKENGVSVEFQGLKSGFLVVFGRKGEGPKTILKEQGIEKLGEKLGENEAKIIGFMSEHKFITLKELAKRLEISDVAVYKNIKKLKEKGLIKRIGFAKGGYWEVLQIEDKEKI